MSSKVLYFDNLESAGKSAAYVLGMLRSHIFWIKLRKNAQSLFRLSVLNCENFAFALHVKAVMP
jgi:hypothetical protein